MRFILTLLLSFSALGADVALSVRTCKTGQEGQYGHGRSVAVSKDTVLTMHHVVVENAEKGTFENAWVEVGKDWIAADVVASDPEHDLALLRLRDYKKLKPVPLLDIPKIEIHGNVKTLPSTVTLGDIDSFVTTAEALGLINIGDGSGLSGSPAIVEGRLIGIVYGGLQRTRRVTKDMGDGLSIITHEPVGPVLIMCIGPNPIQKLLDQHLKEK